MGLDLTLLPLRDASSIGEKSVLCYDRLDFDRDYRIFNQICPESGDTSVKRTVDPLPIPPQMWVETYEGEGIRRTREDKYGTNLTFIYAQKLKKLKLTPDATPKNKAIKAFVDALPDDIPIILFWH